MNTYLNEPNVPAVGGSWIVKQKLVEKEDWSGISARAAEVIAKLEEGGTT
jgi:2-dehydro-3-deoxyphosphogluconate aldolase/(4S)-4-hydroxy-2-oxoglutarate aldolase